MTGTKLIIYRFGGCLGEMTNLPIGLINYYKLVVLRRILCEQHETIKEDSRTARKVLHRDDWV